MNGETANRQIRPNYTNNRFLSKPNRTYVAFGANQYRQRVGSRFQDTTAGSNRNAIRYPQNLFEYMVHVTPGKLRIGIRREILGFCLHKRGFSIFRMGSLAGRAKIHSEDKADQDVEAQASSMDASQLPSTRLGLLERCRSELCSLPPMIGRGFIEADNAEHIASPDTIRIMQWNILAQCE